jgi:lipopolysaccharide/colanic/teichoic acid biosynthesis glycosyltransferase
MLKEWNNMPEKMKNNSVRPYYHILYTKRKQLAVKRIFDIYASFFMLILLSPILLLVGILIKMDSKGPVFFRQIRVTQCGRKFRIFKFRTMVENADKLGSQVTTSNDMRITSIGSKIRKYRIDELPQLINVFIGDMTFVGTRPEVPKYVKEYTPSMLATLLLPAGITSRASIEYREEEKLLRNAASADLVYVTEVLPEKMEYNLKSLEDFNLWSDFVTMLKTAAAVIK